MTTDVNTYDIELPAEFRSGNDIPATVATIKRGRMEEILREAIEADRQRRGEPVARVNDDGFIVETGLDLAPGTLLYAAPQPAEPTNKHSLSVDEPKPPRET